MPADRRRPIVLGRVKWWRETILKPKLGGESQQWGFRGPWFFRLPHHSWPPAADAGIEARRVEDAETAPATEATPTEADPPKRASVASVAPVAPTPAANSCMIDPLSEATEATVAEIGMTASVEDASVAPTTEYGEINWRAPMDDRPF